MTITRFWPGACCCARSLPATASNATDARSPEVGVLRGADAAREAAAACDEGPRNPAS